MRPVVTLVVLLALASGAVGCDPRRSACDSVRRAIDRTPAADAGAPFHDVAAAAEAAARELGRIDPQVTDVAKVAGQYREALSSIATSARTLDAATSALTAGLPKPERGPSLDLDAERALIEKSSTALMKPCLEAAFADLAPATGLTAA